MKKADREYFREFYKKDAPLPFEAQFVFTLCIARGDTGGIERLARHHSVRKPLLGVGSAYDIALCHAFNNPHDGKAIETFCCLRSIYEAECLADGYAAPEIPAKARATIPGLP